MTLREQIQAVFESLHERYHVRHEFQLLPHETVENVKFALHVRTLMGEIRWNGAYHFDEASRVLTWHEDKPDDSADAE